MQVDRLRRDEGSASVTVWLDRTGHEQTVEIDDELTPLGLISRLEWMLDRFDADLAEHRRRLAEAEQRLPACRSRRGEAFTFEEELVAKEEELQTLELALASNEHVPEEEGLPQAEAA